MSDMKQKDDTMRATPETDAASNELGMYGNIVAVDFARQLERQRDEARELARKLFESLDALTLIVGLTAFKYEEQREVLQEAMNDARLNVTLAKGVLGEA
jgi:hypothetical protein